MIRSILVVLPNWLGDLIMATPLLDALCRQSPDRSSLTIHASVRRCWAPLLADDPRIDRVQVYERTGRHAGLRGFVKLAREWRDLAVDAVILCPPSWRVAAAARLAGIPRRVGQSSDGRAVLLTDAVAVARPRGRVHHADELAGLAGVLGVSLGADATAGFVEPRLPGLVADVPTGLPGAVPAWVLAPGATYGSAKAWPARRAAEFIELAVRSIGVKVVIVGDAAARSYTDELRELTSDLPWRGDLFGEGGVVDLVSRTSLVELAGLLSGAQAFVGNDSGVMHLAAALGVPTLGLFGSSSVGWTAPRGRRARALVASGFACQPCFRKTCNHDVFCLETLAGAMVLEALQQLIGEPMPGSTP